MIGDRLQTGTLLAAPTFVAALSIPLLSYQHNDAEFLSGARAIAPFAIAALIVVALGIALAFALPRLRGPAVLGGAAALWILFQDALAPVRWAQLDGTERLSWTWGEAGVQLLVALGIAGVLWLTPVRHRRLLLLVVLAPTFATSLYGLASVMVRPSPGAMAPAPAPAAASRRPNVYQIVLDGFTGSALPSVAGQAGAAFDGFVRFANARASFVATDLSVPNFLTGTVPGRRPASAWARAARSAGIREALADQGYRLALYVPDRARAWSSPRASTAVTSLDLSGVDQAALDRLTLAKISLVRITPAPFRIRTLDLISRYRIRDYLYYRQFNTELVTRFLHDEHARAPTGQYIYLHLMLPHPPYLRDAACKRAPASTYDAQATCALRQIGEILNELRRLGRLRSALVIVQSDHGMNTGARSDALPRPTGAVAVAITRQTGDVGGLDGFLERTAPLLLLHLPDTAPAPARVSAAPALLSDLPATIAKAVGVDERRWPGVALQALPADARRSLPVFAATRFPGDQPLPRDAALVIEPDRGWRFAGNH